MSLWKYKFKVVVIADEYVNPLSLRGFVLRFSYVDIPWQVEFQVLIQWSCCDVACDVRDNCPLSIAASPCLQVISALRADTCWTELLPNVAS